MQRNPHTAEVMMNMCLYQTISGVLAEGAGIVMGTTLTDGSLTHSWRETQIVGAAAPIVIKKHGR